MDQEGRLAEGKKKFSTRGVDGGGQREKHHINKNSRRQCRRRS